MDVQTVLPELLADVPQELRPAFEEAIITESIRVGAQGAADHRMIEKVLTGERGYIALRWSDVDLLKALIPLILPLLQGSLLSVAISLLVLLWEYRRKRVHLSNEDGLLLLTLRQAPKSGRTVDEIRADLPPALGWDTSEIERRLHALKPSTDESGREVPLVSEREGRWRVLDV